LWLVVCLPGSNLSPTDLFGQNDLETSEKQLKMEILSGNKVNLMAQNNPSFFLPGAD
jgi:hypothetical protein